MDWFDRLNRFYQVVFMTVAVLSLLGAFMAAAATISVHVIDAMISDQVQPVREMVEYQMTRNGSWDDFIREQDRKARERKAVESRRAAGQVPNLWRNN